MTKRFAIIGAGMSGILAAIKLREAGHENVRIFEKADEIGGTWRDNVYPGLNCDVPAHCYTYEFAPNPEWSALNVSGPEIQEYFKKVVADYNIRPLISFNAEVKRMVWSDGHWDMELSNGESHHADIVIGATGVLHHPRWPDIAGLDSFAGTAMHTARWDNSVDLSGKRIGIIGNGSTGVQMATALGKAGHEIKHFQRSPQWIMPIPAQEYSEAEKAAFRADRAAIDAIRYDEEYWFRVRRFTTAIANPDSLEMAEIEDFCRSNLEQSVVDPILRAKLTPDYRAACKRLIYSPDYYQAAQLPNVETIVGEIERIVPEGIVMEDGTLHEVDILAIATGYHSDRFLRPIEIKGQNGADLEAAWAERCVAYYAIMIPDFPNLFMLNGPTSPVGNFSLIDIAEKQWDYIEQLLAPLLTENAKAVTVTDEALATYEKKRVTAAKNSIFGSGCTSWYLDSTGVPITWPWDYQAFEDAMAKPELEAFEFS
ncbi:flavin-containing monooxygenase [Parasphingorhabdus halotolerans]|uniref:NAD(P)/FAD-dependent oxidoreductase n=1 Tax=Parasphingorhabdus halotolerans TaxID=2725558 RepID=A0A6H2DP66_9SPHN|nr:NAD(P)/FAD-dependent oxidoreductase [Parasphingorhabdus halotolerans]QJB70180.1 NAD(P)/FAD-dependent oxidoreductase [Parasphingorhabdus halotolerans]